VRYRFYTADVFTDHIFGGNPLAVFPEAAGLSDLQMQQVARELNLSETTFVLPAVESAHTRRLRIFTPAAELPFAGHPTIGTAHVLAETGAIPLTGERTRIVLEEGVGPVPVTITAVEGRPVFVELQAAQLPQRGPAPPSREDLADVLSLDPADLLDGLWNAEAVSCGVPFLFVPVVDRAALARCRVRIDRWEAVLSSYWAPQIFVFTRDAERPGSDLRARMFAPALGLGLGEDPATGSAAAALGGYLASRTSSAEGTLSWVVEQGFDMGRPSILHVSVDKRGGQTAAVRVGGASILVSHGEMEIPGEGEGEILGSADSAAQTDPGRREVHAAC
jgi:trans-2,3-dihydro-3-hydroxyanthranilate isomerase